VANSELENELRGFARVAISRFGFPFDRAVARPD